MSLIIDDALDGLWSTVQMNFSMVEGQRAGKISDDSLNEFAASIGVIQDALDREAKPAIRKILEAIHNNSGCPIDRFCVSGSVGAQPNNFKDCVGFDITVFVDCAASHGQIEESESNYTKKSTHMECAIQSLEKVCNSFKDVVEYMECDHIGAHCTLEGYWFHICVFPSMGHRMHLQRKAVWDMIEELDKSGSVSQNDLEKYSTGLHESTASFMHMGDPVHHGLVRLARKWRSNVLVPAGCEMSALAISLVMMRCIEDEKALGMSVSSPSGRGLEPHAFPVAKIFRDFLHALTELDSLVLTWQRFYEPDLLPERHLSIKPLIVDPVNPWRNIIHNMTHEGIESVKEHASKSLQLMSGDIDDVFHPSSKSARGG